MTERGRASTLKRRWARWRDTLRDRRAANVTYRVVVGVVGLALLTTGIIAIPYPGPGWAIVFVGLALLATEFDWARRLLTYTRRRYDRVMSWFKAQGLWAKGLGIVLTAAVMVGTLWLIGGLSWVATLADVEQSWLQSPVGIGS